MGPLTIRHVLLAALVLCCAAGGPARAQFDLFSGPPGSFAPLVRTIAPVVVGISVTEASGSAATVPPQVVPVPGNRNGSLRAPSTVAAGSGFIVRRDGMIATNDHVVTGASQIIVTLDDGDRYPRNSSGQTT
jgi:S1-C subfamily serine protease